MRRREFFSLSAGLLPLWACRHAPPALVHCPERVAADPSARAPDASTGSLAAVGGTPSFKDLSGYCDAIAGPDASELAERVTALQTELKRRRLAGVIVEPGASMRYLFGVQWGQSERPFMAFVPESGAPTWVSPAFEQRTAREQLGERAKLEIWQEHESAYSVLAESIEVDKDARLAVDAGMRGFVLDGLQRVLGRDRVFVEDPVSAFRVIKSAPELSRLRRANEATKAALAAAATYLRPGMRESEFADLVKRAQVAAGLDHTWALVLFGSNASFPHGTRNEQTLRKEDLVLVDTGGFLHGYASDLTRTWAVGHPSPPLRRAWDVVLAAQSAALEHLYVGRVCSASEEAARNVITSAGFGTGYEFFTHRLGHGIGIDVHEHPYLVRGNQALLQPGMVMSNEPGIYVAGEFGIRIEDIVAITHDGPEVFGPRPRSLDRPFG